MKCCQNESTELRHLSEKYECLSNLGSCPFFWKKDVNLTESLSSSSSSSSLKIRPSHVLHRFLNSPIPSSNFFLQR